VSDHEADKKIPVASGVCSNQIGSEIEASAARQRILAVHAIRGILPSLERAEHLGTQK